MKLHPKVNKVAMSADKIMIDQVRQRLFNEIENIKYYIMNGYDTLSMMVTDRDSKTNPVFFRERFEEKIDSFDYLEVTDTTIKINIPDMKTFDFSGLDIIKQILEGTAGIYVEVSEEDMEKITGKSVVNKHPVDPLAPKNNRIYLEKDTPNIRKQEKEILNKKLVRFPFSNVHAMDSLVFELADEYVDDNLDTWIQEGLDDGSKIVSNNFKGIR